MPDRLRGALPDANVERLILQGTAHLNGIGNAANNTLDGNSGDNSLLGMIVSMA